MAFPIRHEFGDAVQALFSLDHLASGEPTLAAPVLAQFDQIGRVAHRPHDSVELVDAVAVPVREHRHVAAREGGLLMRDGVERQRGIGDDARTVATRNLAVHLRAVGLKPGILDAMRRRADLALRLQRDAPRFKAPMVDPSVDVEFRQPFVGQLRPAFPPAFDHLGAVPVPHLRTEAVFVHRAHRQHDMRVGLGAAVLGHVPMHIEVGDHAPVDELGLHEVAGEFDALRLRHLARKREFHLAGELCVLPDLEGLDIVPKPFAVAPRLRRILRQHDLGMDDAALGGKIVAALKPVVAQPRGRAIGGGRHRAGAGFPADDLDVKMIDRHRDQIITTAKRTSERRISAPSLEKFSGGTTPSPTVPASLQHSGKRLNYHFSINSLWRTMMRKPRDFDAELKSLEDKARDLRNRKVQQLGELVISTGADALSADELAGALIVLAETKDAGKREAWAKRGAAFFQGRSRRTASTPDRDTGRAPAQQGGAQPASGGTGTK